MRICKISTLVLLLAIIVASGCATTKTDLTDRKPYQSTSKRSDANNVIYAAFLNYQKDVALPKGEYMKLKSATSAPASKVPLAVLDTALAGYMNLPSVAMAGAGMGITAMYWLMQPDDPGSSNWIMAWIPKSKAQSLEDARKQFSDEVVKSLNVVIDGDEYQSFEPRPFSAQLFSERYDGVAFHSPDHEHCQESLLGGKLPACFFGPVTRITPAYIGKPGFYGGVIVNAPDFVSPDGGQRYLIRGYALDASRIGNSNRIPDLDSLSLWMKVSELLPDYVYIYLAPRRYGMRTSGGNVVTGGLPLVLNKGKMMLFAVEKQ